MHKTVVLNVVGLTQSLIGEETPNLREFRDSGHVSTIRPALPAVTTTAQTNYLTGTTPSKHGIVGNGWYFRDTQEIRLWQQADGLVQKPRLWDEARQRDAGFTCANLFWWYAMYCGADYIVTPRPMYPADGRKVPDVWTHPGTLRDELQAELGQFPLFKFWGPAAGIECSDWIARAAVRIDERFDPTLTLVYLPHLDYMLQKEGPKIRENGTLQHELQAIDTVVGRLIEHFRGRGARVVILSEYGISPVDTPVHLNRVLRDAGYLTVRSELGTDRLDAGASRAFAVADHQVAHVYVHDGRDRSAVAGLLAKTPGVAQVLAGADRGGLDHPRSGEIVFLAEPGCWFTYYFWHDDALAPDYARTVDIHRKPGYDPVELFLADGAKPRLLAKLAARKLGFRNLLDVTPLDATLVKGSHGLADVLPDQGPLLMSDHGPADESIDSTDVRDVILNSLFSPPS
ncbi:MAG: nucleotide pyrophosphatase/phosphodiesterase family protein [Planctomycetota bacterium]